MPWRAPIVNSKFGKVLVAVRDGRKAAPRFIGYRVERFQTVLSGWCRPPWAGIAGALYVPQVGIINPGEFAPSFVHRSGDLGGGGRPPAPWSARRWARC